MSASSRLTCISRTSSLLRSRVSAPVISMYDLSINLIHNSLTTHLDPVYMEWGTPWGKFLLFCVPQSVKTKETYPTRPGSPTQCKQALN